MTADPTAAPSPSPTAGRHPLGTVYLFHFDQRYEHAGHYTGWAEDLDHRVAEHLAGRGARLVSSAPAPSPRQRQLKGGALMRPTDRLGAAAVAYARLGYRVLPLHHSLPAVPRSRECTARVATRPAGQSASIP